MEKIKWSEKATKKVLERIGEKRTFLNNILCRKVNWIHILRRNCLFLDAIEGQITEVKGVGRRRIQLLDDLRLTPDNFLSIFPPCPPLFPSS